MKVVSKFFVFVIGLVAARFSICASVPPYCVLDRKVVLDSPFALQIGSTEYAEAFGDLIYTSASANYDPVAKVTRTNFYHSGSAQLKKPYFGFRHVRLEFKGEEKPTILESVYFSSGGNEWRDGKVLTPAECRKRIEAIVQDMEKRLGVRMVCTYDEGEDGEAGGTTRLMADGKVGRTSCCVVSKGILEYEGLGRGKECNVRYDVIGLRDSQGACNIGLSYRRSFKHSSMSGSYKPGDSVPVFTNVVGASFVKAQKEKQMKAHAAAVKLREVLKRTFAVDFDETNKTSRADFDRSGGVSWKPLTVSFEGATERQDSLPLAYMRISYRTFAVRRAYGGDVAEVELAAQAKRFLDRLEKDLGAKIENCEKTLSAELQTEVAKRGVPTFGDLRIMNGLDKRQFFFGRVGDVVVEICYRSPRYEKTEAGYEISSRGAVIMKFTQSPGCGLVGRVE
jgi:hypothetical protein